MKGYQQVAIIVVLIAGFALFINSDLAVSSVFGSSGSDEQGAFRAIKAAYQAANKQEYETARSYLTNIEIMRPGYLLNRAMNSGPDPAPQLIQEWWEATTHNGQIAEITFDRAKLNKSNTTGLVLFKIRYQDGTQVTAGQRVTKETGRWRISWTDAELDYEALFRLYSPE